MADAKDMDDGLIAWCDDWCPSWGWNKAKPPLIVERLRDALKDDILVLDALNAIVTVCPLCRDGEADCQCWNDE